MSSLSQFRKKKGFFQKITSGMIVAAVLFAGMYAGELFPAQVSSELSHGFSGLSMVATDVVEHFFVILIRMVGYSI